MIRICLLLLLCVVSLRASAEISTDTINNTDLSGAYALRTASGSPKVFMRDALGTAISITASPYGASATNADNTSAIQSAINAAVAAGVPLRIPAAATCYKYTAPLTITGNLTIVGDSLTQNWTDGTHTGINVPLGTPPMSGSVLCPTANGSDAIDISGKSLQVNISDVGILFQTTLGQNNTTTGDGIHYVPAQDLQGLSGSIWRNVVVYGHDGNHYAYNLTNFIYDHFTNVFAFGGGGFQLQGNSTGADFGNSVFDHAYTQVVVGGTAYGFNLTSNQSSRLNLLTFIRPQSIIDNILGVTPVGNPPTGSQLIFYEDPNLTAVRLIAPDLETNVSGTTVQLASPAKHNGFDWDGAFFTEAATLQAPSWGANGILFGPNTVNITDSTSSGTVAIESLAAFPGYTQNAASATTYSNLSTLYLGKPIAGTNVTATRNLSLYTDGAVFVNSSITTSGVFVTGNSNLNTNATTSTTNIGTGTTSGTVTIGGASNTLNLNAATLQSGGVAAVSCGAGTVNLTTFVVTNGIVTHC